MISVLTPIGIGGPPPGWALYSASNRKYVDGQQGAGWDTESLPYNQSPAIVSGDSLAPSAVTNEGGYPVTITSDGILSVDTGGDNSRQTIPWDAYYYRTRAWAGGTVAYIGNQSPLFNGGDSVVLVLPRNSAITPVPMGDYWSDGESDSITVSALGSYPGTLGFSANNLTGSTPDENRIDVLSARGTDIAGDYDDGTFTTIIGQVQIPDVDDPGTVQAAAEVALESSYFVPSAIQVNSDTVPAGEVVSQSPAAGTYADPYSSVLIAISIGPEGEVEVPDVGGMVLADAIITLANASLSYSVSYVYSEGTLGIVVSQSPIAGAEADTGSSVALTVTRGPLSIGRITVRMTR